MSHEDEQHYENLRIDEQGAEKKDSKVTMVNCDDCGGTFGTTIPIAHQLCAGCQRKTEKPNHSVRLLIKYNDKAMKARTQYKMPMYAYYMGKIFAILDLVGRTNTMKAHVPELGKWYAFARSD